MDWYKDNGCGCEPCGPSNMFFRDADIQYIIRVNGKEGASVEIDAKDILTDNNRTVQEVLDEIINNKAGQGTVTSVNMKLPDGSGNVSLFGSDIHLSPNTAQNINSAIINLISADTQFAKIVDVDNFMFGDLTAQADKLQLIINYQTKSLSAGITTYSSVMLPLVTSSNVGLMDTGSYNQIIKNTSDIEGLKNKGGTYIGQSFQTYAQLSAWTIPDSVHDGDFTYVIADETHNGNTSMYICKTVGSGSTAYKVFDYAYSIQTTLQIATLDTLGVVKGSNLSGQCYIETDGTITLVGFDLLRNDITSLSGQISGKQNSFIVDTPLTLENGHLGINDTDYQRKSNLSGDGTHSDSLLVKDNVGFYEDSSVGIRLLTRYVNFADGTTSTEYIQFPMASDVQGGTITAAIYNQIAAMYSWYQTIVNDNVIEDEWT
jgi:hypothetical protein